ncbi:MAG: translation initiation factor IF-2 [Patescibacteria group bacterium]
MNLTELARRVNIPTQRLKELLPELGFDIGMRAIKVDDRAARAIIEKLSRPEMRAQFLNREHAIEVSSAQPLETTRGNIIELPPSLTVREFAAKLDLPVTRVIVELMKQGVMAAQNQYIDYETAAIIAGDFGRTVARAEERASLIPASLGEETRIETFLGEENDAALTPRPPVVVVMGHVDHGKTTLLDAIRKTNVTAEEHGGITQHIGAYQVTVSPHHGSTSVKETSPSPQDYVADARKITFIDTPGHEAFTTMRSRGAKVADVAILVVAADDGVQPQTIEALTHIQRAELPFMVAVNKIDKTGANPDRVKQELANLNVVGEEWGGKIPFIEISAKKGINVPELLDLVLLIADIEKEHIRANPGRLAVGTIIESHVDQGEGPVATVLVQTGTLRTGDLVNVGEAFGKVKAMKDFKGALVAAAPPSIPVRILGLKSLPRVGDILEVIGDPAQFRQRMRDVKPKKRSLRFTVPPPIVTVTKPPEGEEEKEGTISLPEVHLLIRADVLGSLEAIHEALQVLRHPEIETTIVQQGLGAITEADVLSAEASGACILGFNVAVAPAVLELAKDKGVEIKTFTIIYELVDEVKKLMEQLLAPHIRVTARGEMKIIAIFRHERGHAIIGGKVLKGKVGAGHMYHLKRGTVLKGSGKITSVQIGKQVVQEAVEGQECGLKVETKCMPAVGDMMEIYTEERLKQEIK